MRPANTVYHRTAKPVENSRSPRSAVSLHGHTLHSREGMLFIPRVASRIPLLKLAIDIAARLRGSGNMDGVDWSRLFWTPPLTPRQALDLERRQIEHLGLRPMVSLTDHDDISAPVHLRALSDPALHVPISVEWTFPFRDTFFHLGIHNLPAASARGMWEIMERSTKSGGAAERAGILAAIRDTAGTLIVLNHPCWDEKGIGRERHFAALTEFVRRHGHCIDALEWNGFRPHDENREAACCAERWGFPTVSGGDRHGLEPNSCLNLTDAASFEEFAAGIRHERCSEVLLLPHHFQPHTLRVIHHLWEILRDDPDHGLGWTRWDERVFFRDKTGTDRPLRYFWGDRTPVLAWTFVRMVQLFGHGPVRNAVRAALSAGHEVRS